VFLQITCDDAEDIQVPAQRYSFGTIRLAQARGDFEVLSTRGRRLMRIHFKDIRSGLQTLRALFEQTLS
jgi:transaldolase/glucose-6-phosphate isomerase